MKIAVKAIMAALLFGCLAPMPYGYFQFIRIACCAGFIYLAVNEFKSDRIVTGLLSVAAAILFNPIFKIYLGRSIWNTVDIAAGGLLLIWIISDFIKKNNPSSWNGRNNNASNKIRRLLSLLVFFEDSGHGPPSINL